jgi:hypothetical protein
MPRPKKKSSEPIESKEIKSKTADGSTIMEDFGWYEQKISLARLLQMAEGKDLTKTYVELSFMSDPYNENPHLLLTWDDFQ